MAIQGLRDTSNFVANARPENWRQGLLLLYPMGAESAKAPLTALTSLMKERTVDDPKFHWWEKSLNDMRVTLHATTAFNGGDIDAAVAGTIQVWTLAAGSDAKQFFAKHLLLVEQTGEVVMLVSDPVSDTEIVVRRGFSGTTPAAVDPNADGINPNLQCIGSAFEEGSRPPTGVNYDEEEQYNNCQIFRRTLEMTGTAMETRLRTTDQVKEAKRECAEYFAVEMERAFFFGRRGSTTYQGKPIRTMGGIQSFIPVANQIAWSGGIVTMDLLQERLKNVFAFGSSEKMMFCGNTALLAINEAVRKNSTWNIQNGLKEFGMAVTRLTTPFGELVIKNHPLFNQMSGGANAGSFNYAGMDSGAFILDMNRLQYVKMKNRDVKYQPKLQDDGVDGMQSGYIGECSIEVHHAQTHFLWTGLQYGTVD